MYFTLLIAGQPPEGEEQAAIAQQVDAAEIVSATIEADPVQITPLVEAEPAAAPAPEPEAVIAEAAPQPAPTPQIVTASLDTTAPTTQTPTPAAVAATPEVELSPLSDNRGIGEIWKVTGSTVNLRAGATTQAAVLGRTKRGDSAEMVELLENGWAKVYILESGLEAYISAKFLARDNG